ncbi:MAG: 50S ribosomal protein L7/L12 [Planctomycetes bacterium]|nr:50S ribosomal protein L7/L12 [Planctomycetota bacterium]
MSQATAEVPQKEAAGSAKNWSKEICEVLDRLERFSLLQLKELKEAYEDRFGVTAAAPVAGFMPMAGAAPAAAEAVEVKTTFDVVLTGAGDKKIQVIKVVRELTSLGLKEAKALVDEAPKPVKTGLPREEAEEVKKKLEEAGAAVEIK